MKHVLVIALLLFVAACKAPTLTDYRNKCEAYGFKSSTVEMASCVQQEELARRQRATAFWTAYNERRGR